MNELIRKLVEAYGPSGFEDQMRELILQEIEPHVERHTVDLMGNLIAHQSGDGSGRKVLVAAHMDEIGVMVSRVDKEGFLRFTNIGGVFPHTLVGSRVRFADGTMGVVHNEQQDDREKIQPLNKHYIDIGAPGAEECPVEVGAAAGFWQPLMIQGQRLTAKSMDDRIGCVVIIEALKRLESSPHDIAFVFSVQEEIGTRGAAAAANSIKPEIAIAVDITPAGDVPGSRLGDISLGKGPAIKVKDSGMIAHAGLVRLMKRRAGDAAIPYQLEVLERGSTDARAMQIAHEGSAAGCISIPCRFAHTRSETVDSGDVEQAVNLLVAILSKPIEL